MQDDLVERWVHIRLIHSLSPSLLPSSPPPFLPSSPPLSDQQCLQEVPDDGPTKTILDVMVAIGALDGSAPSDWRGFRELTEK